MRDRSITLIEAERQYEASRQWLTQLLIAEERNDAAVAAAAATVERLERWCLRLAARNTDG
jgi:hypothetical protein